ncbi:MAG: tRNA pseudouridine(38-40) synthase TruA, partial [Tistlia sp.]
GRWTPDDVSRILASRDRRLAGQTAPPHGLTLTAVRY